MDLEVMVLDSMHMHFPKMSSFLELIAVLLCILITAKDVTITQLLDEGPVQTSDDITITAEVKYPTNFTESEKGLC